jgi:hypothetical protein
MYKQYFMYIKRIIRQHCMLVYHGPWAVSNHGMGSMRPEDSKFDVSVLRPSLR